MRRLGNRGPVHDFVEPLHLEAALDVVGDFLVGVVSATHLERGRRRRRAECREDLQRAAVVLRGLPEFDIVNTTDVGKLVRALEVQVLPSGITRAASHSGESRVLSMCLCDSPNPGTAKRPLASKMLEHCPSTARWVPPRQCACRAPRCLVRLPHESEHVEHRGPTYHQVRRLSAEGDLNQVLADLGFVVERGRVRHLGGGRNLAAVAASTWAQ